MNAIEDDNQQGQLSQELKEALLGKQATRVDGDIEPCIRCAHMSSGIRFALGQNLKMEGDPVLNRTTALRLGGICGILFLILFIPSYLSAPDTPVSTSSPQDVIDYFSNRQSEALIANGLLLVFAAFFFLWFLGVLHGVLQGAEEGEGYGFSSVSLVGGVLFVALIMMPSGEVCRTPTNS